MHKDIIEHRLRLKCMHDAKGSDYSNLAWEIKFLEDQYDKEMYNALNLAQTTLDALKDVIATPKTVKTQDVQNSIKEYDGKQCKLSIWFKHGALPNFERFENNYRTQSMD